MLFCDLSDAMRGVLEGFVNAAKMMSEQRIWTQTAAWTMVPISVATTETVFVERVNARSETTQRSGMKESTVNVTTSTAIDPTTNYVEVKLHANFVMYLNILDILFY